MHIGWRFPFANKRPTTRGSGTFLGPGALLLGEGSLIRICFSFNTKWRHGVMCMKNRIPCNTKWRHGAIYIKKAACLAIQNDDTMAFNKNKKNGVSCNSNERQDVIYMESRIPCNTKWCHDVIYKKAVFLAIQNDAMVSFYEMPYSLQPKMTSFVYTASSLAIQTDAMTSFVWRAVSLAIQNDVMLSFVWKLIPCNSKWGCCLNHYLPGEK